MYWLVLEHRLPDEAIREGLAAGWGCTPSTVLLAAEKEASVLAPGVDVAATITDLPQGGWRQVVDAMSTRAGDNLSIADLVENCQRFAAATGARVCTDAGYEPHGAVVVEPTGQCRHAALDVDLLGPDPSEPVPVITSGEREHIGYLATTAPLDMWELNLWVASHLDLGGTEMSIDQCRPEPAPHAPVQESVDRFAYAYSIAATLGRPWCPDSEDAGNLVRAAAATARDLGLPMLVRHRRFDVEVINIPGGSDSNEWAVVVGEGSPRRIIIKRTRETWL